MYKTLQVSVNRGDFQNATFPIQNALVHMFILFCYLEEDSYF